MRARRRGGFTVKAQPGLPGYRLKRVLAHIGDNFAEDLSLSQLAAVAGMSPHYFAELFKTSTGYAPQRATLRTSTFCYRE